MFLHKWNDSHNFFHWIYKSHNYSSMLQRLLKHSQLIHGTLHYLEIPPLLSSWLDESLSNRLSHQSCGYTAAVQTRLTTVNALLQQVEDNAYFGNTTSTTQCTAGSVAAGINCIVSMTYYSSFDKLVTVTAYALRYINNSRKQQTWLNGQLTATELNYARTLWISSTQSQMGLYIY